MNLNNFPFLKPFLWSYDFAALDYNLHKRTIILNILNWGDKRATDWLRESYTPEEIRAVVASSSVSEWNKKSLALWSLVFHVSPSRISRIA